MRVWITRSQPGAARTAEKVRALGHEPVVAPLIEAHDLPGAVDLEGVGALAFTSTAGMQAFAARCPDRGLPVFTVGDATAKAARQAGFSAVASAGGDVNALAALILQSRDRFAGAVLVPGPAEPAGDLPGALAAQGLRARALALYETRPVEPPPQPGPVDAILVHSPKAARRLAEILPLAMAPAALCISAATAEPLRGRPIARLAWAAEPNEDSLLALLQDPPTSPAP